MAQTAVILGEMPVAGGAIRQMPLPHGWYLPGGDGAELGNSGLATADGVIVQSPESASWVSRTLAVWNPETGAVEVLGRGLAVLAAYTPRGAHFSLLAWLGPCRLPYNCQVKITNTATLTTRTVRSPLPGGFAVGGAFAPDGTQLAVFPQTLPRSMASGYARLALIDPRTGAIRVAPRPRITLGQDTAWTLWLPVGRQLVVGAGTGGSYLVDSATLAARPLVLARGYGHYIGNSQDINFTAAILASRQ